MARSPYLRLTFVLVSAVPTTLLYLSTVLDLPFHLLDHVPRNSSNSTLVGHADEYSDEAAAVAVDGVLYVASVAYASLCLVLWTWVSSRRQLAKQLFALPGLGVRAAGQLSYFFIGILPVVLIAIQVVEDASRYHDLFVDGNVTLNALLAVGFDVIIAFSACTQLWYSASLQLQLHSFEAGQDRQRYTRKIYFLYSSATQSELSNSESPSSSDDLARGAEGMNEHHESIDDDNRARRKAYELSMDPIYAGFTKSVMVRTFAFHGRRCLLMYSLFALVHR